MIKIDIRLKLGYSSSDIIDAICASLPIERDEIREEHLLQRTLDLSDTASPSYKCTVAFRTSDERERGLLKIRNRVKPHEEEIFYIESHSFDFRPVVVGAGPAGLFAALALAESGARPIVLERGLPVAKRAEKVALFNRLGILDTECNVQFGEGGAGTFSDGKLKVGSKDPYKRRVLFEFIASGATDDIAFSSTAHLGTDKLPRILTAIREKIESLGGEFIFSAKLTELELIDGELTAVIYQKNGEEYRIDTAAAIIAIGHSARDTVRMLYDKGIQMTPKGFGIGVRIEHKREYINKLVYREASNIISESASYHLVTHLPSGRSVYSFCMCPGGTVVAATSSEGAIVTNGMSEHARMGDNSNSAMLVSVTPADFGSEHPLAGIEYQERIERLAFSKTNRYKAPASTLSSLMTADKSTTFGDVCPTYPRGVEQLGVSEYLPDYIEDSLRLGMVDFDLWMPGFNYSDAVLTGPETRTTSPLRMERDEQGVALGHNGIYPTGEGAGYAGGIVSSATDGLRQAAKLIEMFGK
ncbi:MAG: FAD-binding protein [Clostridia bacterium]|nr:FAD-binding protein [Clostridia bacterium]